MDGGWQQDHVLRAKRQMKNEGMQTGNRTQRLLK